MSLLVSSGAAQKSALGSTFACHGSDTSAARPNTIPKYLSCVPAECLTRPSRLVPVAVSGLRMSYSPSPSSFQTNVSRAPRR